jgi:CSLREA domain-containing protein
MGLRTLRVLASTVLALAGLAVCARPAAATNYPVTKTADTNDGACNADCSLREAIVAANGIAGPDVITVPAGTYPITLGPGPDENASAAGDFDITSDITISGAGAGTTIVTANDADRVFDVNPLQNCNCTVTLSGVKVLDGHGMASNFNIGGGIFIGSNTTVTIANSTIESNRSENTTGGGIENRGTLTLTNSVVTGNTAKSLGGGIYDIGALTATGSTFSGNQAESGGALYVTTASGRSADVSTSSFSGNSSVATAAGVADDGGAIAISTDGAVTVTKSTFTGNASANNGGAVSFNDSTQPGVGTLAMSFNRIAGNTAVGSGNGLFGSNGAPTIEKNWWGCNGGPSAAPCDRVSGTGDFTPWMVLRHLPNPASIQTTQTSTLTADFFRNSDSSTNVLSDVSAFIGVPISFGNPVLGTLSGAQTAIQPNGTATATFTAGATAGNGSADATVDSGTATASITITKTTAVRVAWLSARRTPGGVRLSWRTAQEVGVLGFDVYRSAGSGWRKANRSLIRSVAEGSVAGARYGWVDRAAPTGRRVVYRLLEIRGDGTRAWLTPVAAAVSR